MAVDLPSIDPIGRVDVGFIVPVEVSDQLHITNVAKFAKAFVDVIGRHV